MSEKTLDNLEDMPEYQVGSWRSPFVKIYSIGGKNRIAEISNYPRAYKDTTPHVYTEDVPFIVTKSDLNYEDENGRFHRDSRGDLYRDGEEATHWRGTYLPGAFPLWIESEDLHFTPNPDEHVFPIDKIPGKKNKRALSELRFKIGQQFEKPDKHAFNAVKKQIATDVIKKKRKLGDSNKQIIRIKYRRGR